LRKVFINSLTQFRRSNEASSIRPNAVWCFKSVLRPFLTHWYWLELLCFLIYIQGSRWLWPLNRGCLLLLDTWSQLTAGVTGRQEMLTPPRHLIPPLCPCLPYSQICISYRTYEIDDCSLSMLFHVDGMI
jgi:hypothetical protein